MQEPRPIGSKEWMEWASNRPRSPRQVYVDEVQFKVQDLTGIGFFHIVHTDTDKEDADFERILHIIHDCFEDKTTILESAQMVIEFCKAHNYL
jgi:hypothetical protein